MCVCEESREVVGDGARDLEALSEPGVGALSSRRSPEPGALTGGNRPRRPRCARGPAGS